VRVQLDQDRYDLLAHAAEEASLSVDDLVSAWVRDRADRVASDRRWSRIATDLDQLVRLLSTTVDAKSPESRRLAAEDDTAARRPARRPSLHDEIVEVLRERGTPMTAAEIAREIRLRGEYSAPRSGQPITGTAVSRRVANPYYSSLFDRDGRQLSLADRPARASD
jgi:uncharacterized protein (DUF1778 family)